MVVREERKLPEFGTNGFTPPLEKDGVAKYGRVLPLGNYLKVMAEW